MAVGGLRDLRTAATMGDAAVAAVRAFNRFYTNTIGLLRGKYLDTPYSLTEAGSCSSSRSATPARSPTCGARSTSTRAT